VSWICPKDNDPRCIGHCPGCSSNQIGGGGANGMFCTACGYTWGHEHDESFLDYFSRRVDESDSGTL